MHRKDSALISTKTCCGIANEIPRFGAVAHLAMYEATRSRATAAEASGC
jgi:hypothetical protein